MIELNDVSFHYGGENATGDGVDHITLQIEQGEVVVLVGESGCGKTTITRLINGLAPHFYEGQLDGTVYVDGMCVSTTELAEISELVGSVFQNPKSQFFNMDTTGELAFGCENQGLDRTEIVKRIEKARIDMKLDALMNRNIFELSGGEKQQIACGSVYAQNPCVFVMDEPSSNLDKKAIRRLHDILARMKAEGKTLVLSEHRLHYLMDIADRFVYIKDGHIERIYSAEEFDALSESQLSQLGLRCTHLERITTTSQSFSSPTHFDVAIDALDLACMRGNARILDIDRLTLPLGATVAIIGDNGCGKSTLAESLCGLIPSDGSVAFHGVYMTDKMRAHKTFMVMQDVNRQLFSESVEDELRLNTEVSDAKLNDILDRLGLLEYKTRHPASLSGGQKQRVAIASALCAGKEIIFYDEPTSGLDRRGMERFGSLIKLVGKDVGTSFIITHDPELILQCCTHVLYIKNGRVEAFYPLDESGITRVLGYFLSPSDASSSKKRDTRGPVAKILSYAGEHRKKVWFAAACMTLGAAASLVPYWFVYYLIDRALSGFGLTWTDALPAVAIMALCGVLHAVLYTGGLVISHHAAFTILENLRIHLQRCLDARPLGSVIDCGSGAIKKLFVDDVESIELLIAHMIPEGMANAAVVVVVMLCLLFIDWELAILVAVVIALGFVASRQMSIVGIERMGGYFAASKRLNNTIVEYVNGMEVVRIFNRQDNSGKQLEDAIDAHRDYALDWYQISWPWMALYGSLFSHIVLYALPVGALLVIIGALSLTKLVLVLCLAFGISSLLIHCITFLSSIPLVSYKIQSLEKALDMPSICVGNEDFCGTNHAVEFKNVRFSYHGSEALRGISFVAPENAVTAIVGESGSGKSTIARLLAHQYDVELGSICVGGQDITHMSAQAAAQLISYVSQDVFLFNKSILENIRLGKPDASDEEVRRAACAAQCDEFINLLPHGYQTDAGAAGLQLSRGQRQRIAFARAILKDAPIVILDEATASVDAENAAKMDAAIRALVKDKTLIVIAHKLQSIVDADQIIVLSQGSIEARGTHSTLMNESKTYHRLWASSAETDAWTIKDQEADSC